jgi:hypothetical protein
MARTELAAARIATGLAELVKYIQDFYGCDKTQAMWVTAIILETAHISVPAASFQDAVNITRQID